MKDTRGYWVGDYWGAISIGYNANLIKHPAEDVAGPAEARVQGQGRAERQPAHVGLGRRRRVRRGARRTAARASNVQPGIDFFAKLKQIGNFIPVQSTPQTVASGQTPISIDWDYLNLAYTEAVPGGEVEDDRSRRTASTAPTTARRSTRPLRTRTRRGCGRSSCYSDQGQLIWLKGFSHPARFQDLSKRKVIPKALLTALPSGALYAKVKFASSGQQSKAKALIASQWPSKVG